MDILTPEHQPTEEQMTAYMKIWMKWIGEIESGDQSEGGYHFSRQGKVLRDGAVQDAPYVANKESVAGYILVRVRDIDEATQIAQRCPILQGEGTSVEIRETALPGT